MGGRAIPETCYCGRPVGPPPHGQEPCDDCPYSESSHPAPEREERRWRVPESDATFHDGIRCVEMPCCGFTFDANHFDDVPGEAQYTCPLCGPEQEAEQQEAELRDALRAFVRAWYDVSVATKENAEKLYEAERQGRATLEEKGKLDG